MRKSIQTSIQINASPERVWQVLTDFEKYPEWNPFVFALEGDVVVGKRIKVKLPGMNFTPKVLIFKPLEEFCWRGNLFFPGLFDGEHSFKIEHGSNGSVTFRHEEQFSGILVPLFKKMLDGKTRAGFEAMNQALKIRAES
jgi:hypothetical protein